jgi:hypothetical protein
MIGAYYLSPSDAERKIRLALIRAESMVYYSLSPEARIRSRRPAGAFAFFVYISLDHHLVHDTWGCARAA